MPASARCVSKINSLPTDTLNVCTPRSGIEPELIVVSYYNKQPPGAGTGGPPNDLIADSR
jgi:hypothetical protein